MASKAAVHPHPANTAVQASTPAKSPNPSPSPQREPDHQSAPSLLASPSVSHQCRVLPSKLHRGWEDLRREILTSGTAHQEPAVASTLDTPGTGGDAYETNCRVGAAMASLTFPAVSPISSQGGTSRCSPTRGGDAASKSRGEISLAVRPDERPEADQGGDSGAGLVAGLPGAEAGMATMVPESVEDGLHTIPSANDGAAPAAANAEADDVDPTHHTAELRLTLPSPPHFASYVPETCGEEIGMPIDEEASPWAALEQHPSAFDEQAEVASPAAIPEAASPADNPEAVPPEAAYQDGAASLAQTIAVRPESCAGSGIADCSAPPPASDLASVADLAPPNYVDLNIQPHSDIPQGPPVGYERPCSSMQDLRPEPSPSSQAQPAAHGFRGAPPRDEASRFPLIGGGVEKGFAAEAQHLSQGPAFAAMKPVGAPPQGSISTAAVLNDTRAQHQRSGSTTTSPELLPQSPGTLPKTPRSLTIQKADTTLSQLVLPMLKVSQLDIIHAMDTAVHLGGGTGYQGRAR